MRKYFYPKGLMLIVCLLTFLCSFSQERTITGTVTDDKGTARYQPKYLLELEPVGRVHKAD